MTKINKLKSILVMLGEICHISKDRLYEEGSIDYNLNLDEELHININRLLEDFNLLQKALSRNDMVTVQAALNRARAKSMDLSNFFDNICKDIEMIGWTDHYQWPEIPADYKIPEYYNYPSE